MLIKNKGKVLKIKTGYNPNSSSIGTNITPLIIVGCILSLVIPVLAFFIARHIRNKNKGKDKIV